jgi:hypothetical protein
VNKELIKKQIESRYEVLEEVLNERSRRIWAAAEAKTIGWGGQILVAEVTGIHKNTVLAGMKEIGKKILNNDRIRRKGGGRKKAIEKDKTLKKDKFHGEWNYAISPKS